MSRYHPPLPGRHLVIFAKEPRLGRVKSRLAADVGPVAAWRFYLRTLKAVTRTLSRDPRWHCWLAVTPDRAVGAQRLAPTTCRRLAQGEGDLGVRMARPLGMLPPGPAVIVGTDVPDLKPRHVAAAFKALGGHDAVFGPAGDGGYWLVGVKRSPRVPKLFTNVRWSTEHALADTIAGLPPHWSVALLETLEDVDDGAAFARRR